MSMKMQYFSYNDIIKQWMKTMYLKQWATVVLPHPVFLSHKYSLNSAEKINV